MFLRAFKINIVLSAMLMFFSLSALGYSQADLDLVESGFTFSGEAQAVHASVQDESVGTLYKAIAGLADRVKVLKNGLGYKKSRFGNAASEYKNVVSQLDSSLGVNATAELTQVALSAFLKDSPEFESNDAKKVFLVKYLQANLDKRILSVSADLELQKYHKELTQFSEVEKQDIIGLVGALTRVASRLRVSKTGMVYWDRGKGFALKTASKKLKNDLKVFSKEYTADKLVHMLNYAAAYFIGTSEGQRIAYNESALKLFVKHITSTHKKVVTTGVFEGLAIGAAIGVAIVTSAVFLGVPAMAAAGALTVEVEAILLLSGIAAVSTSVAGAGIGAGIELLSTTEGMFELQDLLNATPSLIELTVP